MQVRGPDRRRARQEAFREDAPCRGRRRGVAGERRNGHRFAQVHTDEEVERPRTRSASERHRSSCDDRGRGCSTFTRRRAAPSLLLLCVSAPLCEDSSSPCLPPCIFVVQWRIAPSRTCAICGICGSIPLSREVWVSADTVVYVRDPRHRGGGGKECVGFRCAGGAHARPARAPGAGWGGVGSVRRSRGWGGGRCLGASAARGGGCVGWGGAADGPARRWPGGMLKLV